MDRPRIKITNSTIIVFSLVLVSSFLFLVIKFYQSALTEATSYHQQFQSEMAKSATAGINYYLEHLGDDLQFLVQIGVNDIENLKIASQLRSEGVNSWFTTDEHFRVTHAWGDPLSSRVGEELQQLQLIASSTNPITDSGYRILFSQVYPFNQDSQEAPFHFLVLFIPKAGETSPGDGVLHGGTLGLLLNFDWLMEKFVKPLKLGEDDFAWVMDNSGRLIYHPRHKEMLLHNIRDSEAECSDCHSSFDVQEQMLSNSQGQAEYLIEGEPSKIMAYEPIEHSGLKWVLAISTYSPSVVKNVIRNSVAIFVLSGVFLALLILTGLTLYYLNMKRVLADEAQKRISQVQRIQEKLDQATKLASLGELIDSVAHEINTPTGIISAVADGLTLDDEVGPETRKEMQIIKKQVHRIKDYTRHLLGYSRVMPFNPEPNNILDLIEECLFLVGPRLKGKQIEVISELPEQWPAFTFDRPRLEQVVINLLNNAIDFMELHGTIIIRLETSSETPWNGIEKWNVLSIQDNGSGIQPGDMARIFEPFVSNKPGAQGTGLGLSISKSIVERHSGRLEVISTPGQGATFSIHLPAENV